jgi:hypothetical protein
MAWLRCRRRHDEGKNGRKTQGNCGRNPPVDTGPHDKSCLYADMNSRFQFGHKMAVEGHPVMFQL